MNQQGDVVLRQTQDGGEIEVVNGVVSMSGGLGTAVYLSLFGGNEADGAFGDSAANWWANIDEVEPSKQYRSATQNLLRGIPATSGNLLRIKDAARRDLRWMTDDKVASSVAVAVSIPAINAVKILISIRADGVESDFEFLGNWMVNL